MFYKLTTQTILIIFVSKLGPTGPLQLKAVNIIKKVIWRSWV